MEPSVRDKVVLDLKRQALASKQADRKAQALLFLKQAKDLQAAELLENVSDETLKVLYLKSLAVHFKTNGEMDEAMNALRQAKQIEAENSNDDLAKGSADADADASAEVNITEGDSDSAALHEIEQENDDETAFTDEELMDEEMMKDFQACGMKVPDQKTFQNRILTYKQKALAFKKEKNVKAATLELRKAKQLQKVMQSLGSNISNSGEDDTNMASQDGWMNELTPEESELLGELFQDTSSNGHDGIQLGESLESEDATRTNTQQQIDWNDLKTLDDSDIKEFLDMEIVRIPSVKDLDQLAEAAQKEALNFKQNGNIEMAKAKLLESKMIKLQGGRLERIYREVNGQADATPDYNDLNDEDMERLLMGNNQPKVSPRPQPPTKPANPWSEKSAEEIKLQVLKLKNEKKVAEAKELLAIYKIVLKKENDKKEAARRAEMIEKIHNELQTCRDQLRLFTFYNLLVDADGDMGSSDQLRLWNKYHDICLQALVLIETNGSSSCTIGHSKAPYLLFIKSDDDGSARQIIEHGTPPNSLDGQLEVSILNIFDLQDNSNLQKILKRKRKELGMNNGTNDDTTTNTESSLTITSVLKEQIQVDVKVQLPSGGDSPRADGDEGSSSQTTLLTFLPSSCVDSDQEKQDVSSQITCAFPHSPQYVPLARGDSSKAKTLLKRIERKRVELQLIHNPALETKEKASSSWFWKKKSSSGSNNGEDSSKSNVTHLGKVVLNLKDLLHQSCVAAGDFPLVSNHKEVGGSIRVCIRTDSPLQDTEGTTLEDHGKTMIQPYSKQLLFSTTSSTKEAGGKKEKK